MMAESWRVAQIVVERAPPDDDSRGSGYLVAPTVVLTAAHVVAGARVVRVRLDVGPRTEVEVQADSWWADLNGTDLAVVMIPGAATAVRDVELARFGRISDCMAVLPVQAFGFPQFKLRAGPSGVFRDLDEVTGHAPVAANRRQGSLAIYLDDPPPEPGDASPWAGMSGAAVWAGGRIVAVVAEHHPGEGTGRLTARRIDRAYDQLSRPDLGRFVRWLGLSPAIDGLPDVVPAVPGQLIRSAYTEQVRDVAPDALIGRDGELAQWAEFCAGPDTYAWWQAGPWAGKTALASWFVTHPPAGIDVVSFFITGRLAGQADSDAFLEAMIEQLNALTPAGRRSPATERARVGTWLSLLTSVAAQAEERGRRLVVVVDGLDEDDAGARPPRGRPSIASLLPRRPAAGIRIIVTSRPDPGLPDDVPSGHPLRTCLPRDLPVSWVAEDLALLAKQELRDLLSADQTAIDVIGYIAGAGGGLTGSDLSALTGAAPLKLDLIVRGVFGRSLQTRASADLRDADPAARIYLFAHETLRVTAEQQLGAELARYRQGIHDWIDSYLDWPDTTPGYAIRGYPRLLITTGGIARLSALARAPRRHAFLLRATGSDYVAQAEIRTALRLIADQDVPDLQALVELAVCRHAMCVRNRSIPSSLPVVWERLGRLEHAEGLARMLTTSESQVSALVGLATAAAQAGEADRATRLASEAEALARTVARPAFQTWALAELASLATQAGHADLATRLTAEAETLARTVTSPDDRAQTLDEQTMAAAQAGDPDRAEALARTHSSPNHRVWMLTRLAAAAAREGDTDRVSRLAAGAETIARTTITDPEEQAYALANVVGAAALTGDLDGAEALARTVAYPDARVGALAALADAAVQAGDPDRATRLAIEAEALARTATIPYFQARALDELSTAAVQAGDLDHAEALARTITDVDHRIFALAGLTGAAVEAGDPDRASRLAAEAETLARTLADPGRRAWALAGLAGAAVEAGDPDRASRLAAEAETLARALTSPDDQAYALAPLVTAAVQAGHLDHAEALANSISRPDYQAWALAELVTAAVRAGDPDRASRFAARAEALARTAITTPYQQVQALIEIATAASQAGDPDLASRLAAGAEALARTAITDPKERAQALAELAGVLGDPSRAEALARAITWPRFQAQALAELVMAAAAAGDPDRASRLAAEAEALARAITDPEDRAHALERLAGAAIQAGDLARAEALARSIADPDAQAQMLIELASAVAQAGDLAHARYLLVLALTTDTPEGIWRMEPVSRCFPEVIKAAGDVFVSAYNPRP
jgi:hypothetical protein